MSEPNTTNWESMFADGISQTPFRWPLILLLAWQGMIQLPIPAICVVVQIFLMGSSVPKQLLFSCRFRCCNVISGSYCTSWIAQVALTLVGILYCCEHVLSPWFSCFAKRDQLQLIPSSIRFSVLLEVFCAVLLVTAPNQCPVPTAQCIQHWCLDFNFAGVPWNLLFADGSAGSFCGILLVCTHIHSFEKCRRPQPFFLHSCTLKQKNLF